MFGRVGGEMGGKRKGWELKRFKTKLTMEKEKEKGPRKINGQTAMEKRKWRDRERPKTKQQWVRDGRIRSWEDSDQRKGERNGRTLRTKQRWVRKKKRRKWGR